MGFRLLDSSSWKEGLLLVKRHPMKKTPSKCKMDIMPIGSMYGIFTYMKTGYLC